tara:strand:+ start:86 stop:424 length:339 start_codon:yes stop_codon:yes gene_type:complete
MKIYHNPRCTKSRETLKIITDAGADVEIVEYLKDIPTEKELSALVSKLGIPVTALLRKGEAIFKEQYKGQTLTDSEWITAMVKYPKLIERPIVVKGDKAILGRPPQNVEVFL